MENARNKEGNSASQGASKKRIRFDAAQPALASAPHGVGESRLGVTESLSLCDSNAISADDTDIAASDTEFIGNPWHADPIVAEPHALERELSQRLRSELALNFSSLVVRRLKDGICLQGVVEFDDQAPVATSSRVPQIDQLARRVAGVEKIINQLVVHNAERNS